ncbi:MAG TPA: response regulator transcription factor [Prolixibacteraceae bacterium]|nr:response regulator transcription factor [Prolixibacteraceae bacterium]
MIRVFIVEDELIHTESIKICIEEAGLEIAGECNNADEAFDLIQKTMPDVLLVDIALPGVNNGITLSERVNRELRIPHIFTTSFTQSQIIEQAVDTNPVAYLRKPVDTASLCAAVKIAMKNEHANQKTINCPDENAKTFYTKIGDKLVRVDTDELLLVKADGDNCITLVFDKREIACRSTLKAFCSQLPSSFIQVHRSYFINTKHLDAFNEREQSAVLKGHIAPVARNFRKHFFAVIQKI